MEFLLKLVRVVLSQATSTQASLNLSHSIALFKMDRPLWPLKGKTRLKSDKLPPPKEIAIVLSRQHPEEADDLQPHNHQNNTKKPRSLMIKIIDLSQRKLKRVNDLWVQKLFRVWGRAHHNKKSNAQSHQQKLVSLSSTSQRPLLTNRFRVCHL